MATKKFSKKEALTFGWNTMKSNLGFFIGFLIIAGLIYFVPSIISILLEENNLVLSTVIDIVSGALNMLISMGLIKVALNVCDNKKAELADLFSCFDKFFKYLFASILYGLIFCGGIILLIVPGIIWAIKFQFFSYLIVDEGLGPIEALKKSAAITAEAKWDLFLFGLLLVLINLLGAICLLVGLFATLPTSMLAMAFVYRKLLSQTETNQVLEN